MYIQGTVTFTGKEQMLPSKSCLMVFLQDNTYADVESITLSNTKFDLSNDNTKQKFHYTFVTKKPAESELDRSFSLYAALHVGWCPQGRETIKAGDYIMDTDHPLDIKTETNRYMKDVTLNCYSKNTCEYSV